MRRFSSIVFATAVMITPALAGAPPKSVQLAACAQKELTALHFYSGPIDGLIGPATRQAGDKYIAWMKGGAGEPGWNQPRLSSGTAALWCEKVASAHPEVAKFYKDYLAGRY